MGRTPRAKIYQRPGSEVWQMTWTQGGIRYRRSAKTTVKSKAEAMLDDVLLDTRQGEDPSYRWQRETFADLEKRVETHYRAEGSAAGGIARMRTSMKHLMAFFDRRKLLAGLTESDIAEYKAARREAVSSSTLNRELACLKLGFNLCTGQNPLLAKKAKMIKLVDEFPEHTKPFEPNEIQPFLAALPGYLLPPVIFGLATGWRLETVLGMRWLQVDLDNGTVHIPSRSTKNKQPMRMPLGSDSDAMRVLRSQWERQTQPATEKVVSIERRQEPSCEYVFNRNGERIEDLRTAWTRACKAAGVKGYGTPRSDPKKRTFHSLRATRVTELERQGVPSKIGQRITGHLSMETYARYAQFGEDEVRKVMENQPSYLS